MKLTALVTGTLLSSLLLTACGTGNVTVSGVTAASVKSSVQTTAATPAKPEAKAASKTDAELLKPVALEPISKDTIQAQAKLRQSASAKTAPAVETKADSLDEDAEVARLIAEAQSKIAEEDKAHAAQTGDFKVKTAGHGSDVDIELFLYHPKYGSKAKSKGILTAADFLEASKSPWRRFTLKLKLEGLFAPSGFNQQVLFWAEQADLLRVTGISRDQAWLLVANGITSVPDLARRSTVVEQAAIVLNLKIAGLQYGMKAPSLDDFKAWVKEAQTLQPVLY